MAASFRMNKCLKQRVWPMKGILKFITLLISAMLILLPCMVLAGQNAEARLEQLQKQMENAVNQGQAPSQGLLDEMQKILEEMQKGEAEDEPEQEPGWVSVPFSGTVTITVSGIGKYSEKDSSFSSSSHAIARAMIRGAREERNENGEIEDYIPQGVVQTQITGLWSMSSVDKEGNTVMMSRSYQGSDRRMFGDKPSKEMSLDLDPVRKVYKIEFPSGWAETIVKEVLSGPHLNEVKIFTQSISFGAVSEEGTMDATNEYPFSPGASSVHDSYSVETWASVIGGEPAFCAGMREGDPLLANLRKEGGGKYLFPVKVTVTWSLQLKGSDVEAVIEPVGDYDNWLPAGGIDGSGNMVKAKVRIINPEGAKGYVTFRLLDVSQVKGICMNDPISNPDTHLDLQFNKGGCSKGIWVGPDGQEAKTESEVSEAVIAVQSLDYGAWGRLEAEVKLVVKGQEQVTRAVYKPLGTDWLALPRDDDGDHVADSWAKQMGIEENAIEDNDPKPGKQYSGDGLSVYEEYRGFMVQGKHVRTDPKVKDLFIWDHDELIPQSKVGSGALGATVVHMVQAEEIKAGLGAQHRMINFNYDTPTHVVDQHGLFIFKGDVASSGYTFESVTNPSARLGPPVETARIEINPSHILKLIHAVLANFKEEYAREMGPEWPDPAWYEAKLAETISFAIGHEVAHGVGVRHHTPESAPPYSCLMSQPEVEGTKGFCAYNLFKGDYSWGQMLDDDCLQQIMISDIFEGQGYLPLASSD